VIPYGTWRSTALRWFPIKSYIQLITLKLLSCVYDAYRTKGRYGDVQQQHHADAVSSDRFTFMSVLVFTQCVVSAAVARLGNRLSTK